MTKTDRDQRIISCIYCHDWFFNLMEYRNHFDTVHTKEEWNEIWNKDGLDSKPVKITI